jgi:hypothetical protein
MLQMTMVKVTTLSIYSADGGGSKNSRSGRPHKDAHNLASQWGLFKGRLQPDFWQLSNLAAVPEDSTMTLKYDDRQFQLFLDKGGRGPELVAEGSTLGPMSNPQSSGRYTIYGNDDKGFDYSFHGELVPDSK